MVYQTFQVVPFKANLLPPHLQTYVKSGNKSLHWTPSQTQADFNYPYAEYYLLLAGENPVGYVGLHKVFEEVTFNQVYIDEQHRRQGLGKQLLSFVLDQLKARKVSRIFLEVRASNQAAISLYQILGFECLVRRSNYYCEPTEDALIMQKQL